MIQITPPQNPGYWINQRALTFSENDLDNPNRVAVSLVSGTVIMAYEQGVIDYAADGNFQKWTLKGYSTKLIKNDAHYIYARLSRIEKDALVVFSVNNYNLDGSITSVTGTDENGNEITETTDPNENYYYIKIGSVTATDGTSDREVTYDSGALGTKKGEAETTDLNEMFELSKTSIPWLIFVKQMFYEFTVKGFITMLSGFILKDKKITDIKRSTDSNNPEEDGYVPVSDETLATSQYVSDAIEEFDGKFLRKDQDDYTPHNLGVGGKTTAEGGIQIGEEFVTGLTGTGGFIDSSAHAELESLTLREFLEVPELRFNRVDVVSGELWNSVAFGTIEAVDTVNQTATLHLVDGELMGLHLNDICRGIFHNLTGNASADTEDDCGFLQLAGFSTSYFTPVQLLDDGKSFRYTLRNQNGEGQSPHPVVGMKFAVYGNFTDSTRQASAYSTRTYKRYLSGVYTWEITSNNIVSQFGDVEGLTIGDVTMHGYGSYQHNVYLSGAFVQFTKAQEESLKGNDAYSVHLSDYESLIVVDYDGNIVSSITKQMNVVSGDNNIVTTDTDGTEKNVVATRMAISTRIQAFRGKQELYYSEGVASGAFIISLNCIGCTAYVESGVIFVDSVDTSLEKNYIDITVNCEGNASFNMTYTVNTIRQGESHVTVDLDNEMESVPCDGNGNVTVFPESGIEVNATMFYGNETMYITEAWAEVPSNIGYDEVVLSDDQKKATLIITSVGQDAAESNNIIIHVKGKTTVSSTEEYERTAKFVLNKVAMGENAVMYRLIPSVSSVKISDSGEYSVSSVYCTISKIDGKSYSSLFSLGEDSPLRMEYRVDSGDWDTFEYGSYVNVKDLSAKQQVSFKLYYNSILIDAENIPIVSDGNSPVFCDLDNEMAAVACDGEGKITGVAKTSTTYRMWGGNTELELTSLDAVSSDSNTSVTSDKSTGLVTVTVTDDSPSKVEVTITGKATYQGVEETRSIVYTVNKINAGKDALIYQLNPSDNAISVDADGNITPSNIYCYLTKRKGTSEIESITSGMPDGYEIHYWIDDNPSYVSLGNISSAISTSGVSKKIRFELYYGSILVDVETVPVAKDGEHGKTPVIYSITPDVTSVKIDQNGQYSASLVTPYIVKTVGEETELLSSVPTGFSLGYVIDDKDEVVIAQGNTVPTIQTNKEGEEIVEMITFNLYKGADRIHTFMVPVITDGSIGETTSIYSLNPSTNVIKVSKDGTYSPSTATATILQRIGKVIDAIENPSELGYSVTMYIDGVQNTGFEYGVYASVTSAKESVDFYLIKDGETVDHENIPVLYDGDDGKASLVADLTNDTISVACDENGIPTTAVSSSNPLTTSIVVYHGTDAVTLGTDSISVSSHTGITMTKTLSSDYKKCTINVTAFDGSKTQDKTEVTITAKVYIDSVLKTLEKVFTINKVKKGKQGEPGESIKGDNGESAVVVDFDNDMIGIPCDSDGKPLLPIDGTTAMVYSGTTKQEGYSFSATFSSCEGSIDEKTGKVTIDKVTGSSTGMVNIIATKGENSYSTWYYLYKVKEDNATVYYIEPSVSIVERTGSYGSYSYNPSVVTCKVYKRTGSGMKVLADDVYLTYKIGTGTETEYTDGVELTSTSGTYIYFYAYTDSTKSDKRGQRTVYIRNSGTTEGIILTNQTEYVACDADGNVYGSFFTSNVKMYYGTTETTLTKVSVGSVEGVTASGDTSGVITVSEVTQAAAQYVGIPVSVTGTVGSETYSGAATLKLSKIIAGSNGTDGVDGTTPVVLALVPSDSVIKKDTDGNLITTTISCGVKQTFGAAMSNPSSLPTGYTMGYRIDSGTATDYTVNASVDCSKVSSDIVFYLYYNGDTVDEEKIHVVSDGKQGDGGDDGVSYSFSPSAASVNLVSDGTFSPTGQNIYFKKSVGSNAPVACSDYYLTVWKETSAGWSIDTASSKASSVSIDYSGKLGSALRFAVTATAAAMTSTSTFPESTAIQICYIAVNKDGEPGANGYFPRDRGLWSSTETYYYQKDATTGDVYRDKVIHYVDGVYYNFLVKNRDDENGLLNVEPTLDSDYWEYTAPYQLIVANTFFATNANMGGFMVTDEKFRTTSESAANGKPHFQISGSAPNMGMNLDDGSEWSVNEEGVQTIGNADGERIVIDPHAKALSMFDEDGNERTVFDGKGYTYSELIPSGGSTISINSSYGTNTSGKKEYSSSSFWSSTSDYAITSASFTTTSVGTLILKFTGLRVTVAQGTTNVDTTKPYVLPQGKVQIILKSTINSVTTTKVIAQQLAAVDQLGGSGDSGTISGEKSLSLGIGTHSIYAKVYALNGSASGTTVATGYWTVSSIQFSAESYMSRHFANGMMLSKSTTEYFMAMEKDGAMNVEIATGGNIYKFNGGAMSVNGIKQPVMVYAARITDTSTSSSTSASKQEILNNGSQATLTKTSSQGVYTLSFPASYGLTSSNMLVNLEGYSYTAGNTSSPAKATLASYSVSSSIMTLTIWVSDDDSRNYGGFYIEVKKIL